MAIPPAIQTPPEGITVSATSPHRAPSRRQKVSSAAAPAGESLALTGQLGQAVGPGPGVRGAVEGLPVCGGLEAVVGARVDHQGVRGALGDLGRERPGGPVGQREDHDVVAGEDVRGGLGEDAVRQGVQVRLEGVCVSMISEP